MVTQRCRWGVRFWCMSGGRSSTGRCHAPYGSRKRCHSRSVSGDRDSVIALFPTTPFKRRWEAPFLGVVASRLVASSVQAPMRSAIFGRCCRLPNDTVTTSFRWWCRRSDDGTPCDPALGVVDDWRRWRRFGVVQRSQKTVLDAAVGTVPTPFWHHWWRRCRRPLKRWKCL